jgi:hypothetical protein
MRCLQFFGVYGPVPCFGVVPPHDADRYHVDKGLVMYGELNLLPRDDIGQSVEHFTGPFELVKDAGLVPRGSGPSGDVVEHRRVFFVHVPPLLVALLFQLESQVPNKRRHHETACSSSGGVWAPEGSSAALSVDSWLPRGTSGEA